MSRDSSSTQPIQQNENEFGSLWNQLPLVPPRAPLNSIPDPSQYQSETPKKQSHDDLDDFRRKKPEGIAETQLVSAVLKTPKVHGRGKSTSSEPNSAQSTPNRSGHRLSIGGSGLTRLPAQLGNGGGRGCGLPKASRRFSIATPQQLLTDVPHFELEDDPSFWNDHNVQVLIRIRPLNSTEMISQGYGRCLRQESAQTVVWLGHPETRFTFDHIAGESISQEKLFRAAGLPMVDNCMSGYNSCMFAYGQTGSGKTYTMMGEIDKMDGKLNEDCGITPRIFEYLFSRITKEEESRVQERLTYSCKCSFLEIYNEQITDLLEPSSTNLQLREDSKKGVYVENLTEHSVRTVNDVLQLLQQGAANRRIAATHMNCESSRSHSVFTCIIESRWEKDSMAHLRFGRLNLVDLAGSERQKSSGAEGDRLKEAANINKSLSTLGLVIMSLVDLAQGKHRHVPYRDSRLTFLLQDSLGGNSKTTIIANVSPSICAANETLSTLKFAQRAKLIQNNAKINEDASAGVIALQQQILHLKDQLSFLMKHQHDSVKLIPGEEHSSLGFLSEGYDPTNETGMHDEDETWKGGLVKKKYFKATLLDASRREKLAETEIKSLKAEIESLNRLAHQHEEEAQRARMMLKFQEEKTKHLELLLNGLVSVDKLSLDENTALRDENLSLQAKIERKAEVIKFATEKNRFQDFHEQGERKTLLAEISESHNQLLESLEVQKIQAHHQLSAMEKYQEPEVSKELEQCREMNAKLLREVDELQRQLSNRRESSEDTFNSIYNVPRGSDMADGATSNNFPGDEVTDVNNEEKSYLQIMQCDNIDKQLMDAQSLIETLKLEQLKLITELESVKTENQLLVKMLESNQYSTVSIEGNEGASILALQDKLEKLSKDLKEAHILNKAHIEDRAARISQDHQAEVVLSEVEMETTRTIIHLQEEIDRLQSEFHCCLCSVAEENLSLRKSVAAKEDELRVLCKEWERATLELTTFLIDSSRSMGNASREIKSISSSFPNVNGWINEHVEMAAKMCVEKEETILLLQNSLEDAQNTVIQMEEKLHSLRGATIALTKVQQSERFSSREEIQLSRMPHDMTGVKDFPVHKFMSKKGDVTGSQAHTSIPVETRISNHSTSTPGGIFDENQALVCASTLATRDVDIQVELTTLIAETKNAVNGSCADAEAYISAMNSEIHDTISLAKGLNQDVIKDVNDFRNDIDGLKRNRGSLHFLSNTFPSHVPFRHGNQLLMLQQVRNELVEINDRLNSMSACFYKVVNMHCNLDSTDVHTEIDGCTSGCFSSCSSASVESFDNDDKPSSSERYRCMDKITDQPLDLNSDEQSNLTCKRAILLLRKEFRNTYEAFIKIKNHLMVFSTGEENQNCSAGLLSISDLHAEEKLNKHGNGVDQPTSKRTETYANFGELAVEEKHNPPSSFFTKCEEAYAAMKEADYMLKAMLKANEHANTLTTMWKQAGEELMSDNASLSEEVKQLKSCVHLKNGEKEVLLNAIQSTLSEKADILSSLEECLCAMQTGAEELFKTASSDVTNVVEEMKTCFDSFRSSLEDLMCKAIQNDISIFVLQFQIGEYSQKFQRLNTISNSDRPILQEHPLVADNIEPSQDHNSVLEPAKCGSKVCQVACVSRMETTESEMVDGDDVDKSSKLQRELERKDILLKGLLFDFSLLQEFASHRKDIKDELEKLIVAMSKVQKELHTKSVQLDDILVEKTKLEGCLSEAEQALFSSKSELNQAKEALNIFSEQNVALKDILRDLYLKNSEAEELLEDRKEAIKSLEGEIIRLSSQEKHSVSSVKDYEDALMNVTAERDQLLEKLTSLQDKLDMVSSVADENQAIAAEARQESETSKMYAEQKEEEVKILERSVEELESTINVLEKKVLEMEGDVKRQRLIRDSLEVELQALRERLLTVEDLTESMTSENSSAGVLEDQLSRKLHSRTKKINEAHSHIRFLEEENAKQAEEIRQFRDYISELVLHAEAQASQYQQKYKTLEAMLKEVRTDVTNVSAAPTSERADKLSARTRGSSSPFRCIAGLVQQMNQEKDQELSSARLRIEELEALAACRYKEVCVLNTRLATAESMTHDVIRDLLSVKLDISNYANIIEQHQLQELIEEAQHRRQDFVAMEHEVANLRSQIDDLLEERERCYAEINRNKADQLALQIALEQLQEQDQFLIAQNDMLKMDKCNLQKRVAELDDMVKKLFSMQDSQPQRSRRPFEFELGERLAHSQKMLSRVNGQLAQYRRPEGTCSDSKMVGDVNENMSRGRRSRNQNHS